jgi:hypothetical protein
VDTGGAGAEGAADGVGDGDGATAAGAWAGGALAGGGLDAGAVAVGAGGVAPGTVTVTGETPGVVVVARLAAAPLGGGWTANTTRSTTASSALRTIGQRAIVRVVCPATATRCSLGVSSRILKSMNNPFHRAYVRRRRRAPTWALV